MKEFMSQAIEETDRNNFKGMTTIQWNKSELTILNKLANSAVNGKVSCASVKRLYKQSLEAGAPLAGINNKSIYAFNTKFTEIYRQLKSEK